MLSTLIQLHVFLTNLPVLTLMANGGANPVVDRRIQLAGFGANMITDLVAGGEDSELQTNYWGIIYLSLIILAYIAGMSYVIRTLYLEKKERLTPFTPESIRALAPNPDRDADGKALDICSELDDYPPIDNKQIANKIRQKILEAASFGPTGANVLERLNGHIERLNAATKRSLTFPGFTTIEKHSCMMPALLIFAIMLFAGNLSTHNCPAYLIPFVVIFVFAGLYAIALTPEYMREKMNNSYAFHLLNKTNEVAIKTITETAKQADKPVVYEVRDSWGEKRIYESYPSVFAVVFSILLAVAIGYLIFTLSVYILLFLTVFFICQNYVFSSANTLNYCPNGEAVYRKQRSMLTVFRVLLAIFTVLAALATGFDLSGIIGMPFNGVVVLFIPDCFFSYFNSLSAIAHTLPGKQREAMLEKIDQDIRKFCTIVMLCTSCWLVYVLVTDIFAIRITRSNAAIRSEQRENEKEVYDEKEEHEQKMRERKEREEKRNMEIEQQREQIRQEREEKAAQHKLEREQKEAQRRQELEQQKEQNRQRREEQAEQRRRQAQERTQQRAQQRAASRNNRQTQQPAEQAAQQPAEQAEEQTNE